MRTEPTTPRVNPRDLLQRELERRCKSNPRYSLRAFARAMAMSPTSLSLVLTGKRPLSRNAARRLADRLSLAGEECLGLVEWAGMTPRKRREADARLLDSPSNAVSRHYLSLDSFAFISDWYHYAILSLLELPGSRFDARWISRTLGVSEIEAKNAMERLERMGIIEKIGGRWRQVTGPIRIASDVPTAATKKFQKQLLAKAIESIENDPDEVKDMSSMTLAMDPALIPYAKQRIREFRRGLAEDLEAKGSPKRVYEFTVQIFPVSRPSEKKERTR